jgi:hypothetical protein
VQQAGGWVAEQAREQAPAPASRQLTPAGLLRAVQQQELAARMGAMAWQFGAPAQHNTRRATG